MIRFVKLKRIMANLDRIRTELEFDFFQFSKLLFRLLRFSFKLNFNYVLHTNAHNSPDKVTDLAIACVEVLEHFNHGNKAR